MQAKQIIYGEEARKKLAVGAEKLAKAVISTLGPRSRNVAINGPYYPNVIHDGVTVAKAIKLEDDFEDMGAQLIKQAASQTNDLAGDGTTTATLLANFLVQEGMKLIEGNKEDLTKDGMNPMELKEQLEIYADRIVEELSDMAKQIKDDPKALEHIATISAQNEGIGKMVAEAINKVGESGIVMVEEGNAATDNLELQEGMEFENGWLSPYFVTDANRLIVEYQNGYVLLTDERIYDPEQIKNVVTLCHSKNKPLLIIADDVVGTALASMIRTKLEAGAMIVAVVAPEYADRRREMLEDLAVLTGGTVVSQKAGLDIKNITFEDLGQFRKIEVTPTHTKISPLNPDPVAIKERVEAIRLQIEEEKNNFRRERLEYRMAKLGQGIAIITVGGGSQSEIGDKKEKFIDAIHATKAALSEGIVPGGGIALGKIIDILFSSEFDRTPIEHLIEGMLLIPYKTILSNSGVDSLKLTSESVWVGNNGYDVITKKVVDMYEAGIVDPVKVTKLAVKHAVSVASMILTTDVLVSDVKKKDEKN